MKKIIFLSMLVIFLNSYAMAEDESLTFPDGSRYVGQFKDGKRHGKGTMTYSDDGKYEGQWRDGKKYGQGTWTSASARYEGQWKDDKFHGQGTYTSFKRNEYEQGTFLSMYRNDEQEYEGI